MVLVGPLGRSFRRMEQHPADGATARLVPQTAVVPCCLLRGRHVHGARVRVLADTCSLETAAGHRRQATQQYDSTSQLLNARRCYPTGTSHSELSLGHEYRFCIVEDSIYLVVTL